MDFVTKSGYKAVVDEICRLGWSNMTRDDNLRVAHAYYYFSIQFRENLLIACTLYPDDANLRALREEECDTANLSPWPGIAAAGEKLNHDEFVRRILTLEDLNIERLLRVKEIGQSYLAKIRAIANVPRALSIASYEDGGLEKVFRAFLKCQHWDTLPLQAFRHFLVEHIKFDSNPEQGHGALSRHLTPDERVLPLWIAFRDILVVSVPSLS